MTNFRGKLTNRTFRGKSGSEGLTLLEVLITTAVFVVIGLTISMALQSGQGVFAVVTENALLQENLNRALERISLELRHSGVNKDLDSTDPNYRQVWLDSTTSFRFSIPVVCHSGDALVDSSSKHVAHWGATKKWSCNTIPNNIVGCTDHDGICAVQEYKFIQYTFDSTTKKLMRNVLDTNSQIVSNSTDVIASNVEDFSVSDSVGNNLITIAIRTRGIASNNRPLDISSSVDVHLRN